jgi:hypothetical protein
MNKAILFIISLITPVFLISCDNNDNIPNNNSGQSYYPLENEITRSPDGEFIYFITADSSDPDKCGIYRAPIANPLREIILIGTDFHSPVGSPDGRTVAYLLEGIIHYYSLISHTVQTSKLPDSFESIVYVDDTLLVACRDTLLYLIDEADSTVTFWQYGWDPTYVARDRFAYFRREAGICNFMVADIYAETLLNLRYLPYRQIGRWPTYIPSINRAAYSIQDSERSIIYSFLVMQPSTLIDSSSYPQSCLADLNLILFTGPDDRIYQSDFSGNGSFPYIGFYEN